MLDAERSRGGASRNSSCSSPCVERLMDAAESTSRRATQRTRESTESVHHQPQAMDSDPRTRPDTNMSRMSPDQAAVAYIAGSSAHPSGTNSLAHVPGHQENQARFLPLNDQSQRYPANQQNDPSSTFAAQESQNDVRMDHQTIPKEHCENSLQRSEANYVERLYVKYKPCSCSACHQDDCSLFLTVPKWGNDNLSVKTDVWGKIRHIFFAHGRIVDVRESRRGIRIQ